VSDLSLIAPHIKINGKFDKRAHHRPPTSRPLSSADLIIDATADRSVAAKIERLWWTSSQTLPANLCLSWSGTNPSEASLPLPSPGSTGAGADILRRFAHRGQLRSGNWRMYLTISSQNPPRSDVFPSPRPGVRTRTFVGFRQADLGRTRRPVCSMPRSNRAERHFRHHRRSSTADAIGNRGQTAPPACNRRPRAAPPAMEQRPSCGTMTCTSTRFGSSRRRSADMRREVLARRRGRQPGRDRRLFCSGKSTTHVVLVWVSQAARPSHRNSQASPDGLRLNIRDPPRRAG